MSFLEEDSEGCVEIVMAMPPLSTAKIERQAYDLLREIAPEHLRKPQALDVMELIDYVLPRKLNIHFAPVEDEDLPDAHAMALHAGSAGDPINVIMRKTGWDALCRGGRRAHHPRGSFGHELGHCILHVPVIRRRRALGRGLPRSYPSHEIEAFRSAEWQSWCFGTCLLAPRAMIVKAGTTSVSTLAKIFDTSESLMAKHLARLGLAKRRTR